MPRLRPLLYEAGPLTVPSEGCKNPPQKKSVRSIPTALGLQAPRRKFGGREGI
jgi:hypothetical protein